MTVRKFKVWKEPDEITRPNRPWIVQTPEMHRIYFSNFQFIPPYLRFQLEK